MTKVFQQLVDRPAAHILQAQAQQKYYADGRRREAEFNPGDEDWLSTKFMQPRGPAQFQPRSIGTSTTLPKAGKVACRLELPRSVHQQAAFHGSLLQGHKRRPTGMLQPPDWEPVNDGESDQDPALEVQHILYYRVSGKDEEFLVQWKGFPVSAAIWEPLSHLDGCKDLLKAFRASKTRRREKHVTKSQTCT